MKRKTQAATADTTVTTAVIVATPSCYYVVVLPACDELAFDCILMNCFCVAGQAELRVIYAEV